MRQSNQKIAVVRINDLKLQAIIGTEARERDIKQDIIVDIEFLYDSTGASGNDDLAEAVDYGQLVSRISNYVDSAQCYLLEKLTDSVLEIIAVDARVIEARVRISKPGAVDNASSVSVERHFGR